MIEEKDILLSPQSVGIRLPTNPPTNMPIKINFLGLMAIL
jgi:hypothetical protein